MLGHGVQVQVASLREHGAAEGARYLGLHLRLRNILEEARAFLGVRVVDSH
jgi:hypothetical protein